MTLVSFAWLMLVLIHAAPAAAAFSPRLRQRLYGVKETPTLSIMLAHRGALFLAVAAVCGYAAFNVAGRPAAALVAGISVLSYLLIYALSGSPKGALRTVAIADVIALPPLAYVIADVFAVL